jgi:hypothetical protein
MDIDAIVALDLSRAPPFATGREAIQIAAQQVTSGIQRARHPESGSRVGKDT